MPQTIRHLDRGYAAIGLDRVKNTLNIGSVLRAAGCFGASLVVVGGGRIGKSATDTMKAYRHVPSVAVDDVWQAIPFGAVPVVIELCDRARPLQTITHPESAFYIFGPEDGSVRRDILDRAPVVAAISAGCLNLAAAVNIVLYDRAVKRMRLLQKVAA